MTIKVVPCQTDEEHHDVINVDTGEVLWHGDIIGAYRYYLSQVSVEKECEWCESHDDVQLQYVYAPDLFIGYLPLCKNCRGVNNEEV